MRLFRRPLPVLALLLGGGTALLQQSQATAAVPQREESQPGVTQQDDDVDGLIIKYRSEALESKSAADLTDELATSKNVKVSYGREMSGNAHVLSLETRMSVSEAQELAKKLVDDPRVIYAEPDYRMHPQHVPNDTQYGNQWHYFEATGGIRLPLAWNMSTGGGVNVAVIDSGYRPHADLAGNVLAGYDFITNVITANDGNGRDSDATDPGDGVSPAGASSWHGTHVAGTIAAIANNSAGVAGVAFDARIVPVRVLGVGGGTTSDIVDGMRWAAGLTVPGVPSNTNPAEVLNLSLGAQGACAQTWADAITDVRAQNATIVVAAGNLNSNVSIHQPANCSGVISVAATQRSGGKASYSNYGSLIDLAAPGGETATLSNGVLSTGNSGTYTPGSDNYVFYQGTSMAAPHVSGVAALLYSLGAVTGPSMTPTQVETILKSSARAFPSACTDCGTGIVDASAALLTIYAPWAARVVAPAVTLLLD